VRVRPGDLVVGRYLVGVQVDDNWGVHGWRARDELLGRDILLTTCNPDDPRADALVAAGRRAAALEDHRVMRVLDAHRDAHLAYLVREWVGSRTLADVLRQPGPDAGGPLSDRQVLRIGLDVAAALAAGHRLGLSHLCLDPSHVLLAADGSIRVRGIGTAQVLRGVVPSAAGAAADDARGLGVLLFAMLTGRMPDDVGAGLPAGNGRRAPTQALAPRQVRAGVHPGLDKVTCRALQVGNGRADALTSPAEVVEALADVRAPRLAARPVGVGAATPRGGTAGFTPDAGPPVSRVAAPADTASQAAPPSVRWVAAAAVGLVIAGLALLGLQILDPADAPERPLNNQTNRQTAPVTAVDVRDFDPFGNGAENPEQTQLAVDGDLTTVWPTQLYFDPLEVQKPGVGLVLDLGQAVPVREVDVALAGQPTSVRLLAADEDAIQMPTTFDAFDGFARIRQADERLNVTVQDPPTTRFVLVWLTRLPPAPGGWAGGIREVEIRS
jgi:putative peptidoglycan lipid II flippase